MYGIYFKTYLLKYERMKEGKSTKRMKEGVNMTKDQFVYDEEELMDK